MLQRGKQQLPQVLLAKPTAAALLSNNTGLASPRENYLLKVTFSIYHQFSLLSSPNIVLDKIKVKKSESQNNLNVDFSPSHLHLRYV